MPPNPHGPALGNTDGEPRYYAEQDAAQNPYYANRSRESAPDLDAGAPLLKHNDLQRLNRKALLFLAGIIALLIMMTVWLVGSATSADGATARPREETVVIPELPRDSTGVAEGAPPVELAEYATPDANALPPLPVEPAPAQSTYASEYPVALPPRASTLRERRMNNIGSNEQAAEAPVDPYVQAALAGFPGNPVNANVEEKNPTLAEVSSAQFINNPDALLVRGTYVRCVLETRLITDIPGFASCFVTEPVYSINGHRLLLPRGSKISGRYNTDPIGPRISVIWDRITTPNGIDVSMASPGVDNLGGAGHPGDYNAHWGGRIASALMISLISDVFKYAGAEYGPTSTTVSNGIVTQSPFESNTARTMERLASQALDRSASRPATVTINQGTVLNVYVAKDVDFSAVLAPH